MLIVVEDVYRGMVYGVKDTTDNSVTYFSQDYIKERKIRYLPIGADVADIAGVTLFGNVACVYDTPEKEKELRTSLPKYTLLYGQYLETGIDNKGKRCLVKVKRNYDSSTFTLPTNLRIEIICDSVFEGDESLKTVILPDGVSEIGAYAFVNCHSLTNITLPVTLKKIDTYAFIYASSLKTVTIPEGVEYIGMRAFAVCGLTNITIPNSVNYLGKSAFANNYCLSNVILSENLTEIEAGLFMLCLSLKNITIPKKVEQIGEYAFYGCESLETIEFPPTLKKIDQEAFGSCILLKTVLFNDGLQEIGKCAFRGCKVEEIAVPDSVKKIGSLAFGNCIFLKKVLLPSLSDIELGKGAFKGCNVLNDIVFGNDGTHMEFINDKSRSLTDVNIFITEENLTIKNIEKLNTLFPENVGGLRIYPIKNGKIQYFDIEQPDGSEEMTNLDTFRKDTVFQYSFPRDILP